MRVNVVFPECVSTPESNSPKRQRGTQVITADLASLADRRVDLITSNGDGKFGRFRRKEIKYYGLGEINRTT